MGVGEIVEVVLAKKQGPFSQVEGALPTTRWRLAQRGEMGAWANLVDGSFAIVVPMV